MSEIRITEALFPLQNNLHKELDNGIKPGPRSIPWPVAEKAYSIYSSRYGKDQSLEQLAQRGGFSLGEMDDFYPEWRAEVDQIAKLQHECDEWKAAFENLQTLATRARNLVTCKGEWRECVPEITSVINIDSTRAESAESKLTALSAILNRLKGIDIGQALEDLCKAKCYFCRAGDMPVLIPQSGAYLHRDSFQEGPETGSWPFHCRAADIRRGTQLTSAAATLRIALPQLLSVMEGK